MRATCTEPACGRPAFGRGLCKLHYDRVRYARIRAMKLQCKTPGCCRAVEYTTIKLCRPCYTRQRNATARELRGDVPPGVGSRSEHERKLNDAYHNACGTAARLRIRSMLKQLTANAGGN